MEVLDGVDEEYMKTILLLAWRLRVTRMIKMRNKIEEEWHSNKDMAEWVNAPAFIAVGEILETKQWIQLFLRKKWRWVRTRERTNDRGEIFEDDTTSNTEVNAKYRVNCSRRVIGCTCTPCKMQEGTIVSRARYVIEKRRRNITAFR